MRAFIGLLFLGIIGFTIWTFNTILISVSNGFISFFMGSPMVLLALGISLIICILGLFNQSEGTVGFGIFVAALGLIVLGPIQGFNNHLALNNASRAGAEAVMDADALSYGERVPYDVAVAVSNRSLGDTTGNANDIVKAVPKDNQYTTLVIERGIFKGYESVQSMKLPKYGSFSFNSDIEFCKFSDEANYRFGGAGWSNNIDQHAYWTAAQGFNPLIRILEEDSFAVCENGTPKLYMPATTLKFEGLIAYRVPAGVVIYNGETNDFSYENEVIIDGYPIYPNSVAVKQRESMVFGEGFWNYMLKRSGYETTEEDNSTSSSGDTTDSTNLYNSTEFVLNNLKDGTVEYVTPLTPRGSSSSVVALSTVKASSVSGGKLNPLTIHKYDQPRQAPSTLASNIVSTTLSGYRASGLTVFEVIPSKDGSWTATIGKKQSILYRAVIDADGTAVLVDELGEEISLEDIDSSYDEKENVSKDRPASSEDEELVILPPSDKKVKDMTVQELKELMNAITSELAARAEQ